MSNGRFNRTPDTELRIAASGALTPGGAGSTANTTAVAIGSVGAGDEDLGLLLNVTALAGTHDASNYLQLQLQASTDNSTFKTVETVSLNTADAAGENQTGANLLAINTREIVEAVGNENAAYYRILATQVGTTATAATFSAYFVKGV